MNKTKVFVALPHRPGGEMSFGLWQALNRMGQGRSDLDPMPFEVFGPRALPCSMLPLSFNMLWCEALNLREKEGITHFAMLHSDVAPLDDGWLRKLLLLQQEHRADIMSTVIALKDDRGQSSTGVMNVDTREMRKLTLAECHKLPPTFDVEMAGFPGHCLLMNSGCWICDFTQPWVEKMCFRFHDHVVKQSDGQWRAACVGEDWLFSIDAWRLGLRCFATRELAIEHQGVYQYPNMVPWGTQQPDVSLAWNIEPPASWRWIEAPVNYLEQTAGRDMV